LISAVIQR